MTTDLLMTTKDIAAATHLGVRMINIYRAQAERRLGVKFGRKEGRYTYFSGEEVREILKSRDADKGGNAGNGSNSPNYREATDFSDRNNDAEDSSINGMEGIVAASDQKAIAIGQAIGQRFVQTMWTTALSTMQQGLCDIGGQFSEIHNAIALPLADRPALTGSDPSAPRLQADD